MIPFKVTGSARVPISFTIPMPEDIKEKDKLEYARQYIEELKISEIDYIRAYHTGTDIPYITGCVEVQGGNTFLSNLIDVHLNIFDET